MSSFDDAMELWVKAGGSPQSAAMAAAVADASSGLNPNSTFTGSDGTVHKGLWAIPATLGPLSTTDPLANARAAIQLSDNGTDFSKWDTAWSDNAGGRNGGEYLGDGSNALAALAQRGGTYNVIGGTGVTSAVPTGVNNATYGDQTDNTVTSTPPSSGNTSNVKLVLVLGLVVVGAFLLYLYAKGKRARESDAIDQP